MEATWSQPTVSVAVDEDYLIVPPSGRPSSLLSPFCRLPQFREVVQRELKPATYGRLLLYTAKLRAADFARDRLRKFGKLDPPDSFVGREPFQNERKYVSGQFSAGL